MEHNITLITTPIRDLHIGPPTFSRLPPDGHEFPPNFSEPIIITPILKHTSINSNSHCNINGQIINGGTGTNNNNNNNNKLSSKISDDKISSSKEDAPPLPKTVPPTSNTTTAVTATARKIYRQDLIITVDDARDNGKSKQLMDDFSGKKVWNAAILEDKNVRKEIMIMAKNGTSTTTNGINNNNNNNNNNNSYKNNNDSVTKSILEVRRRSIENNEAFRKFDVPQQQRQQKQQQQQRQFGTLPSNWRKDEKSEKSVRDKIAMFSTEDAAAVAAAGIGGTMPNLAAVGCKKLLNKSTENLLSDTGTRCSRSLNGNGITLTKKAQSVENLDDLNNANSLRSNYLLLDTNNGNNGYRDPIQRSFNGTDYLSQYKSSNRSMEKAFSVEHLNHSSFNTSTVDSPKNDLKINSLYATPIAAAAIPPSYASLPRSKPPSVTRTTSFSGSSSSNGNGTYEDRRRSSINHLLEQRKKSMSKLRGLIIPEKTALGDEGSTAIFDLPEIQNTDAQKVFQSNSNGTPSTHHHHHHHTLPKRVSEQREPIVPNPKHYIPAYQNLSTSVTSTIDNSYKNVFQANRTVLPNSNSAATRALDTKAIKKISSITLQQQQQQQQILPPIKPPRTSLILVTNRSLSQDSQRSRSCDDSEDSDSVFSSKVSTPPGSPIITNVPSEKFPLTRTLSSETNTSIASSTASTLTSGSGSQASCSSAGSTPTIDMSRKINKSSSNESYVNRKNILALAKCRSGKDDSGRQVGRYEDEDSTDGCDDDCGGIGGGGGGGSGGGMDLQRQRVPKTKIRSMPVTLKSTGANVAADDNRPINYRLVSSNDNLVDMIINVASYVEVTSDTDADSKISDSHDIVVSKRFIDEERKASFKASKEPQKLLSKKYTPIQQPTVKSMSAQEKLCENSTDLAKWVRSEVAKSLKNTDKSRTITAATTTTTSKLNKAPPASVTENIQKFNRSSSTEVPKTPVIRTKIDLNESKKSRSTKAFDLKMNLTTTTTATTTTNPTTINPIKSPKYTGGGGGNYHERFSSLDSLASSSSGVSSSNTQSNTNACDGMLQQHGTPTSTDYGSFSSYGSNHSLITPADLQQLIEEAEPPLKQPEAFVVVLQRDQPESSVGVTLAGGADYETKEITIHRILSNSPAYKDGRLRKGDRLLSINGLSMRGLTHRESVSVLKTPRSEVVMVVTRSETLIVDDQQTKQSKRISMGSMSSLNEKNSSILDNSNSVTRRIYHKASRSLDLDLDRISNSGSLIEDCKSIDGGADGSTSSSMGDDVFNGNGGGGVGVDYKNGGAKHHRIVEILKDSCGLGLAIEGGLDSPLGHKPLTVKKVFMGGAAEKTGQVSVGDVILSINDFNTENMTRVQAWNYMKSLPSGPVKFVFL